MKERDTRVTIAMSTDEAIQAMAELVRVAEGASEICIALAERSRDLAVEYALEIVVDAIEDAIRRPVEILGESAIRWR